MTIYETSVRFSIVDIRSIPQMLFEEIFVMVLMLFCGMILIKLLGNANYDNI